MIPLRDENPTRSWPLMTVLLIGANVFVFLHQVQAMQQGRIEALLASYAMIPAQLVRDPFPEGMRSLFTSMFLHGDLLHMVSNMWFLWIFGNNVEDRLGAARYLAFYAACGLVAALAHAAVNPASPIPVVGASGAISGVLGAYLVLFPHARIVALVPLGFFLTTAHVPAFIFLILWFVLQLVGAAGAAGARATSGVAWWAHVGGFAAGIAFLRLLAPAAPRRRGRPNR